MKSLPPFLFGAQYFRPPFPLAEHWEADLARMRDAGLNSIQCWVVWGWVEPQPGRLVFADYDRLFDLAANHQMGVVLSVLPEVNPFWLDQAIPDGRMIDIEGRPVRSCARNECISGLVPGLCSDHPDVRKRMTDFVENCARHFAQRDNLLAWDCWNENRWRNHSPEIVCFCPFSIVSFRKFLAEKWGSLEALSDAWGRRYGSWNDVHIGRLSGSSYPEMHDFTDWMCSRATEMARWRVNAIRAGDPDHFVSSHTGNPSIYGGISMNENLFARGIDWDVAAGDGYGFSSFPKTHFGNMSPTEIGMRMSAVATAAPHKPLWMSELQGGQTCLAGVYGDPVRGDEQQAWVWTGIARGVKGCIFWCWRNEIFGGETDGFGITAADGFEEDRLRAMTRTAQILKRHGETIAAYEPDSPQVGVLFQRDSYFFDWMGSKSMFRGNYDAPERFKAWPIALERLNLHYAIHDDRHLPSQHDLKLMIVPDAEGLSDEGIKWLFDFASGGGTVLVEGVAGSHTPNTFLRDRNRRPLYQRLGVVELLQRKPTQARRTIPPGAIGNGRELAVQLESFEASYSRHGTGVIPLGPDRFPMLLNIAVGQGKFICVGSIIGRPTNAGAAEQLDQLLESLAIQANVRRSCTVHASDNGFCSARFGRSGNLRLLVIVNFGDRQRISITLDPTAVTPHLSKGNVVDWFDHPIRSEGRDLYIDMGEYDQAVLEF